MYSVGILFMQLVFVPIRSDNGLAAFNKRLASFDYDLNLWRDYQEGKTGKANKDWAEGFAMMDLDGGAAWDLVTQLVKFKPGKRLSASAALAHPWVTGSALQGNLLRLKQASSTAADALADAPWIGNALQGTQRVGGLTEAQLTDELGGAHTLPQALKDASATVAWWRERQQKFNQKLDQKRGKLVSSALRKLPIKATKARK